MAKSKVRVVIPSSPVSLLALAGKVYQKSQELGATSPLSAMQSNNWETNGPNVATALGYQQQAEALKKQVEKLYEQRDLLLGPIKQSVRSSRDILLGIYSENPKELGEWGYEVNDSQTATQTVTEA